MNLKGILFDMDGVLVDSEEFICEAAICMFREKGIEVKAEDFVPFIGMGENRYLGGVAEKYHVPFDQERDKRRTYEIYEELTKGKLKALPGVHRFIEMCRKKGLKIAIATSADRVKLETNLRALQFPEGTIDATVNGLEVEHKKPDPEIYLVAAQKLGLHPEECLVVEDAVSGVKAGKAAGCKVLAVRTSFPAEQLKEADWICTTLAEVPPEALKW